MNFGFLALTSFRYLVSSRKGGGRNKSNLFSVAGIAIGVMTLISVLAIMDGFQSGYIQSILDIDSYHLRLRGITTDMPYETIAGEIAELPDVESVIPFVEGKAIVKGIFSSPSPCMLRGISADAYRKDTAFRNHLEMLAGVFSLELPYSIVLGSELAQRIGVTLGDSVEVISVSKVPGSGLVPLKRLFTVTGIFKSGYYDFDLSWAFVSLDTAGAFFWNGRRHEITLGIRIRERFKDLEVKREIKRFPGLKDFSVVSWREYNRSYFNALLMEKIMMFLLLSLIFIVVGFNIYHSQRRNVYEKTEDIAILKAIGAKPSTLREVFLLEGIMIGTIGAFTGTALGIFISFNINAIFSLVEMVVNTLFLAIGAMVSVFSGSGNGSNAAGFSIFSPTYFYLNEVPVKIYVWETMGIVASGILISLAASYFASKRILSVKPSEILRNQ